MTLKKVSFAIISVLLIACICVGFAFLLKPVESVGVASALEATLPDDGIVGANYLQNSYYTDINPVFGSSADNGVWYVNSDSDNYSYSVMDGYTNFLSSDGKFLGQSFEVPDDLDYNFTFSMCYRLNSIESSNSDNFLILFWVGGNRNDFYINLEVTDDFVVFSYNITSTSTYVKSPFEISLQFFGTSVSIDVKWLKFEIGSSFTGYVIEDRYSEGYDEGYEAGVSDGTQTGYNNGYDEGYEAGVSDGTQTGYDNGYDEGYEAGVSDGTQTGYDEGYQTGYDEGYQIGYDEGNDIDYDTVYEEGYDDGYESGVSDGIISANDIFICSAVDIEYDSSKDYIYFNPNDVYSSYANVMVNSFAMAFVPLSSLRYDDVDGGFYPVDIVRNSEGELPDVKTSAYYMVFNSLVDVGQWLLDNPNDYLCSYAITGEAEPAAIIFADLSRLDSFMSGASVNYQNGYDDGYGSGFASGENTGYNKGYSAGYNKGTVEGSDYSFIGLIGSVLDAPISAFKGLLNFDILGVNMASFVTAILSLCVVIVVVKICMR